MLVGEEEGDVVMEDKIEVTVHVIGIFCECAPTRLFLCSNIPRRQSQMINLKTRRKISKDEMDPGATKLSNCQQYNFSEYKSWNHLRQDSSTI